MPCDLIQVSGVELVAHEVFPEPRMEDIIRLEINRGMRKSTCIIYDE